MKSAVIITGHLRNFQTTLPQLQSLCIKWLDADVYGWFWSDVGMKENDGGSIELSSRGFVDTGQGDFDLVREMIPDIKISVNDYEDYHDTFVAKNQRIDELRKKYDLMDSLHRTVPNRSQWFTWKQGFKMVEDSGIDYDVVVRTRPDIFLFEALMLDEVPESVCFATMNGVRHSHHNEYYDLEDLLIYGSTENMKAFCSLYDRWDDYIEEMSSTLEEFDVVLAPHRLYNYHCRRMNLPFDQVRFAHRGR